jgi:hypothetical protein
MRSADHSSVPPPLKHAHTSRQDLAERLLEALRRSVRKWHDPRALHKVDAVQFSRVDQDDLESALELLIRQDLVVPLTLPRCPPAIGLVERVVLSEAEGARRQAQGRPVVWTVPGGPLPGEFVAAMRAHPALAKRIERALHAWPDRWAEFEALAVQLGVSDGRGLRQLAYSVGQLASEGTVAIAKHVGESFVWVGLAARVQMSPAEAERARARGEVVFALDPKRMARA